LTESWIFFIYS